MQHPDWFQNTVEPRLWAITNLDYGPYLLYSAAAEVQPQCTLVHN